MTTIGVINQIKYKSEASFLSFLFIKKELSESIEIQNEETQAFRFLWKDDWSRFLSVSGKISMRWLYECETSTWITPWVCFISNSNFSENSMKMVRHHPKFCCRERSQVTWTERLFVIDLRYFSAIKKAEYRTLLFFPNPCEGLEGFIL